MPRPKAPRWNVAGDIPDIDPQDARTDQLEAFDEDMLQMTDPTGRYTVDVGWYPAASKDGQFVCRVITSEDWDRPTEYMETSSSKMLWAWLRHQVAAVTARIGEAGSFATNIGLYIYRSATKAAKTKKSLRTLRPQVIPAFLKPITAIVSAPFSLLSADSGMLRTANPSTGISIGIGLGTGLPLNAA